MISLYGFDAGAVVFDCDGVLVDSEPASERAWRRTLADFGLGNEEFARWVGRTDAEIAEHYAAIVARPAADIAAAAARRLDSILAEGLTPFGDAVALLARAEGSATPVAVGSNSDRRRLQRVLAAAGLGGRFAVQVSSSDVSRPKPAPDIYLRAAEMLGVAPAACLVVEDSPAGIAAARQAGMFVVAVDRGCFPRRDLADADRLVTELDRG